MLNVFIGLPIASRGAAGCQWIKRGKTVTFRNRVTEFYQTFSAPTSLSADIELINPYEDSSRRRAIEEYYAKFFNDENVRVHILGINPSRMHPTATGVNYTDGYALENFCGIENSFSKSRELTSDFFYQVVDAIGGAEEFFGRIFPWAMMPVTVTKKGNYANYYGNDVVEDLKDLVRENVKWTSQLPSTGRLVILGSGENQKFFENLPGSPFGYNDVRVVPHPRWVLQYNRANVDKFIGQYVDALT
jgi:hypothetical protein